MKVLLKPEKKINLEKKLERIFSKYIRLRDAIKTTGSKEFCRCVTCQRVKHITKIDAGHCFSSRYAGTKFEETNVHGQCRYPCNANRHSRGEINAHKLYIRMTYGQVELDRLEYLSKKLTVQRRDDWYLEKISYYEQKIKELENRC